MVGKNKGLAAILRRLRVEREQAEAVAQREKARQAKTIARLISKGPPAGSGDLAPRAPSIHDPKRSRIAIGTSACALSRSRDDGYRPSPASRFHRRMIRRPAGYLGIDPAEPKLGKIEFVGKDVDHPNGIVLADPVFQAFRKQRALPAIRAFNEAPHPTLPQIISRESHQKRRFHTGSVKPRRTQPEVR